MHTAENAGFNPHASLAGPNLRQRWSFGPKDTARDDVQNGFGPPVYANGTVYVGGYERLWALDPGDGTERWRYTPDRSGRSDGDVTAVGVAGDTVFLGTDHGRVVALTADDGTERWTNRLGSSTDGGGDEQGEAVRIAGLTAAEGYVLAVEDGTADEPAVLYALDAANGAELWHRTGDTEARTNPIQPAAPALHDGVVYDTTAGLVALEARSGEVKWGPRSPETNDPPAYSDGRIFVSGGTDGNAYYAIAAETGKTEWKVPFSGDPNVGARLSVVDDRRVYAGYATGDRNRLVAFDRVDGSKVWTNGDVADGGRGAFSADTAVLYANETGGTAIVALDPTDGTKLWAYKAMDRGTVPALVGSTAFFGGPKVVAIGAESTPTPTPADRQTPTGTGTATGPGTPTQTGTRTPIGTQTPTDTPTDRGTPTSTPTDTPVPTDTPTEVFGPPVSPTTTDGPAPGLGILGTVGGLLGVAGYLRYRAEDEQ